MAAKRRLRPSEAGAKAPGRPAPGVASGARVPALAPTLLATCLAVAVVIPFAQLWGAAFINFDDPSYVTNNPYVLQGITGAGVRWALTTGEMGNWNPLTWVSHMLDVELFGLNAGGHHLTSVALHALNTVLLFVVLRRMTGTDLPSALVAFLFGAHPLHVESVAWVSERKDVLSTTFLFLALLTYAAYVERPTVRRYLTVAALFALGLMCKPMLVTFPFLLLLLDVWPLRRIDLRSAASAVFPARAVLEKLPLVATSIVASVVTLFTQRNAGALDDHPMSRRAPNAVLAYVAYLRKMIWPADLSCFYPYPREVSWVAVIAAALLLAGVSVAVVRRRDRPYLLVGWLWFVGMLVPVIGLVQVGAQAFADRYTYVPLVGVFVVLVWGAADAAAHWRVGSPPRYAIVSAIVVACMTTTWVQVSRWHDSGALFRHALAVTRDNSLAYLQLGAYYDSEGQLREAAEYFTAALGIKPNYAEAHNDLGWVLAREGDPAAALEHYDTALRLDPLYPDAHYNRGLLLQQQGRADEAAEEYERTLAIRPSYVEAHSNLAVILQERRDLVGARAHLTEAVRLRPDHVGAHVNLGVLLRASGDLDGAIAQYEQALRLDPALPEAHYNLGNALAQRGDVRAAIARYREALRLKPDYTAAEDMLRQALAHAGD